MHYFGIARTKAHCRYHCFMLLFEADQPDSMQNHIVSIEDQEALRGMLVPNGLVAFVADGAILPRDSGASDLPMQGQGVVRFQSPEEMSMSFTLPSGREVSGMGIRKGITLIVGGGVASNQQLVADIIRRIPRQVHTTQGP